MNLQRVTLEQFKAVAENAHLICFDQTRLAGHNTFDFALFVEDEKGGPLAYATCIEMDKTSVYMQHGGAFPPASKGITAVRAYHLIMKYLRENYFRASTIINSTNKAMIKMAWSAGFEIHGADVMTDGVWLHLMNEMRES